MSDDDVTVVCMTQVPLGAEVRSEGADFSQMRSAGQASASTGRTFSAERMHSAGWMRMFRIFRVHSAYQTTIDLLPQFIWLGTTTDQCWQELMMTKSLAGGAAAAAIHSSEYKLAIEWLEHTRCVVWNQHLLLRSPLDQLHSANSAFANRLQTVANQLHRAGSDLRAPRGPFDLIAPEASKQHHHLVEEYDRMLSEARQLLGFEDFLRPIRSADLVWAARNGPIVVINCAENRCDALLILPGQDEIIHIPLQNFTEQTALRSRSEIADALRRRGIRERGVKVRQEPGHRDKIESVLLTLWDDVVKPVLDRLGYTCPIGALSFLPLHAAGDYSQPRSRVFDYAISSYTPTITALLTSTPSTLSRSLRVLAIGQTNTPGRSALPGASRELAFVKSHTESKAEYSQLLDNEATIATTLSAMEQHAWVHLACHAHQNIVEPKKSGFFLHDGTLDLATINQRSFKNKGLAFLSACQTATGSEHLPDEAAHLASGMLMSGYSSVIATMWSVIDEDAPLVADKVYAQLMKEGKLGNGEAGKALHTAVGELREKVGEKEFGRWVPYIHIGS